MHADLPVPAELPVPADLPVPAVDPLVPAADLPEPAADLVGHLKLNIIIHVIFIEYVMYNRAEF